MKNFELRTKVACGVAAVVCSTSLLFLPLVGHASEEAASYPATVRATLEQGKRGPTGREASLAQPSGAVAVAFTVDAQGRARDVALEQSSRSMLLDAQAVSLVRRAHFPAPADGQAHRFAVRYAFSREPSGTVTAGPLRVASR